MAARIRIAALLLLATAAACHDSVATVPPTFDRFYYPTGMAVRHDGPPGCVAGTAGCRSELFVASSNFDLRYDPVFGGTVLAVDPDLALGGNPSSPPGPFPDGSVLGTALIGTFAGEAAVLDTTSCPDWRGPPQVLVTSRGRNSLFRLDIGADGSLTCGDGCEIPLSGNLADAYGVTVACGVFPPAVGGPAAQRHLAFVSFLRGNLSEGFISRIDLDAGVVESTYDVGPSPVQSMAFDQARGVLFLSELFSTVGVARLRWIDLAFPLQPNSSVAQPINFVDYGPVVRGAELVTLALSSSAPGAAPSRAYVAARLYDVDSATSAGVRPVGDVGAALLVVDLEALLAGSSAADTLLGLVRLDRGPASLAVISREDAAMRDLVAVTSSDDGVLTLYDDELGQVVSLFSTCASGAATDALAPAPCDPGRPSLGQQPFNVAAERFSEGGAIHARLFVASFDRSWVNSIVIDPVQPALPLSWGRIGPESPFASPLPGGSGSPASPYPGF